MYVVFLAHTFLGEGVCPSGVSNYVANMAQALIEHGHRVTVITEGKEEKEYQWNRVKVYQIRATGNMKDTGRKMTVSQKVYKNLLRTYYYNKKVEELHRLDKVDLVQCVNSYGIGILRSKKMPYLVRISDYGPLWGGARQQEYDMQKCLRSHRLDEEMQLIALKRANRVIAPSKLISEIVGKRIHKEIGVVESPVSIDAAQIRYVKYNESLGITSGKYWITFGGMTHRKSIYMLAQIIDQLLDCYPDMKYVMVGKDRENVCDGEYMRASKLFEKYIVKNRDRFIFTGEISDRPYLFELVKNAKFCILPTRVDNFPNAVIEAMALGKIVISSDKTSVEQIIRDGYNGFLTQIDDGDELFARIRYVMDLSNEEMSCIEAKAKERVIELAPEKVYEKMIAVYEETIKRYHNKS